MGDIAPMPREIALRIALAARALPDTDPRRLLRVLEDITGLPPTPDRLAALKIKQLRSAADGELAEIDEGALLTALDYLTGARAVEVEGALPQAQPYGRGDLPDSVRVACASNQGEELDGHFGSCARFLVYQVNCEEIRLVDLRSCETLAGGGDKNAQRAELISDCQVLFVASIGGPAAAKVVRAGVHPIKHPQGGSARTRIEGLQAVLKGAPPPWLAKAMGHAAEQRVRFERADAEA